MAHPLLKCSEWDAGGRDTRAEGVAQIVKAQSWKPGSDADGLEALEEARALERPPRTG
jgi:hypothetical protein